MLDSSTSITFPKASKLFSIVRQQLADVDTRSDISSTTFSRDQINLFHHPFATSNGMSNIKVPALGTITATARTSNRNHLNSYHTVHGGWTATMADSAMAAAAQTLAGENEIAVTTELTKDEGEAPSIKFDKSIKPGEKLIVTAKVLSPEKAPIVTVGSIVKNENNEVVLTSAARFFYDKKPPVQSHSTTIDDASQTWSAVDTNTVSANNVRNNLTSSTPAFNFSITDPDFNAKLQKIRGKNITLSYSEPAGEGLDSIEIKINDVKDTRLEIELNADNNDELAGELDDILSEVKAAKPAHIEIEEQARRFGDRGNFAVQVLEDTFTKVA